MPAVNRAHKQAAAARNSTQRNPIRSRKAREADDRFGVLAYEGVGPSCPAARAVPGKPANAKNYRGRFIRNSCSLVISK
jgi:hypothetical protein